MPYAQFFAVPQPGVAVRNYQQQSQWQEVTSERESLCLCKLLLHNLGEKAVLLGFLLVCKMPAIATAVSGW